MYYGYTVGQKCLQAPTNGYSLWSCQLPINHDGAVGNLEHIIIYIDDILMIQKIGESEEDNMKKIEQVLERQDDKGFQVNLQNSFFM